MEQRKFSERDFPALVEARRYTELLRSMEAGRDALLAFPDGRSLDSFRQTAYRENISLKEACVKLGFLTAEQFDEVFHPEQMV